MNELDDIENMDSLKALADWLASRKEGDDLVNTCELMSACVFALMHFEKLSDDNLRELMEATIRQAHKQSAYADAVNFMYDLMENYA